MHFRTGGAAALVVLLTATALAAAANPAVDATGSHSILAFTYPEGQGTKMDIMGVDPTPGLLGEADVKRKEGRARVQLRLTEALPHPQSLGAAYTAYLLWAATPEGRAEKLAELPHGRPFEVDATTSSSSFGLFVTAEPHAAVLVPGPRTIAENALRRDARNVLRTTSARYAVDPSLPETRGTDFTTPLLLLGARHAVALARESANARHAEAELREAEVKLAALEQLQLGKKKVPRESESLARDVMRLAEEARSAAGERAEQARLAAERTAARHAVAQAQSEAERARLQSERDEERARAEQERARRAQEEAAANREAQQRAEEERRRAEEENALAQQRVQQAQVEADRARQEALRAQQEKADLQERLFQSLSAILDTRREARGLIVSLSDVLFDFNRASLKPGAREKLSKLAGILLAYPGRYNIEIEGHTDSVGTHAYNERLSQGRAESVNDYIVRAGIPAERVTRLTGFGETHPVATNDTAVGRQMNRRVEIVITDLETP